MFLFFADFLDFMYIKNFCVMDDVWTSLPMTAGSHGGRIGRRVGRQTRVCVVCVVMLFVNRFSPFLVCSAPLLLLARGDGIVFLRGSCVASRGLHSSKKKAEEDEEDAAFEDALEACEDPDSSTTPLNGAEIDVDGASRANWRVDVEYTEAEKIAMFDDYMASRWGVGGCWGGPWFRPVAPGALAVCSVCFRLPLSWKGDIPSHKPKNN